MCSDAIDQCRCFDAAPSTRGYERRKRCTKGAAQLAIDKSNFTIARSCNQNAKTIGDTRPCNIAAFRGYLAQTEISDKAAQVQSERTHLRLGCCVIERAKFEAQWAPIQTGVKSQKVSSPKTPTSSTTTARAMLDRITHIASDLESAKIKAKSLFDTLNMPQNPDGLRILDQNGHEVFFWTPRTEGS